MLYKSSTFHMISNIDIYQGFVNPSVYFESMLNRILPLVLPFKTKGTPPPTNQSFRENLPHYDKGPLKPVVKGRMGCSLWLRWWCRYPGWSEGFRGPPVPQIPRKWLPVLWICVCCIPICSFFFMNSKIINSNNVIVRLRSVTSLFLNIWCNSSCLRRWS